MPVRIERFPERGQAVAHLSGEIDHHSAREIREKIDLALQTAPAAQLVLDFKKVSFMDSSGIGLVLGRYRLMQELGGELRLQDLPDYIRKVMRVAGIENLQIIEKEGERNESIEQHAGEL